MPSKATDWTVEIFYFGSKNSPSSVAYRSCGKRLQVRIQAALRLVRNTDGLYEKDTEGLAEFMKLHQDSKLVYQEGHDVHPLNGGGRTAPTAWIEGWKDVTTARGRKRYLEDKDFAMKRLAP